ncbi:Hypothetical protein R9X50_00784500 [Acrodontium crateriforme]|uniref:WD40 repeat-like protein n=1 Tax=Acrodontium crateriforme TaxID=150365 RepID=A0AAQ3REC0_9PEZI|nr:Hypothetical protein R9X50_00784500 [Acrodontium crateriforme]
MNTRQAIQPSDQAKVLSLAFSLSRNRFIAGLSEGIQIFRSDNCLTTHQLELPKDGGVAIAEAVDDRYVAYVGGGNFPVSSPNVLIFWDAVESIQVTSFDLHEPIRGLRVNSHWLVVLLDTRAVVFEHQQLKGPSNGRNEDQPSPKGPNRVHALYPTANNIYALASLQDNYLALPASAVGQIQIIPLDTGSKRVLRAHTSSLRAISLSPDGTLLASASEQGTLIRVYSTSTLSQVGEFRRGIDQAIIYNIAFSPRNRWLASTSDKGTLHIFDLRPRRPADSATSPSSPSHRHSASYPTNRLSSGGYETASNPSSIPTGATSIQEYYGLRPPPVSNIPSAPSPGSNTSAAATALAAFKASPFAPRIVHDIRSVASTPFYTGNDTLHWQDGGPTHAWTVAPNGTRKRVRRAVTALPGNPTGKPVKGIITFASIPKDGLHNTEDEERAVLYVIGGGSDARWEAFDLLPSSQTMPPISGQGNGWTLINRGFRRFMTRQYV